MIELRNWPPSRGPNPCTCKPRLEPGAVSCASFELQRPEEITAEREQIATHLAGLEEAHEEALLESEDESEVVRPRQEPKLVPITGTAWGCAYGVEDVASLTLEQAVNLLCVHPQVETPHEVPDEAEYARFRQWLQKVAPDPDQVGEEEDASPLQQAVTHARGTGAAKDYVRLWMFYSVGAVLAATQRDGEDRWYGFEPRKLVVEIDYPLDVGCKLVLPPMQRSFPACAYCVETSKDHDGDSGERLELSPGYLLWMIAKQYERIYAEHEKYGVWGHALSDLVFEGFSIDDNGVVHLQMGS